MELFSHNVVEPDKDLLQMVEALGSQIGLFIERGRIVQELERQKKSTGTGSIGKNRFLGVLTDKLRAPLAPVLNWAGTIAEQSDLNSDVQQGLKMIRGNVELEMRLIEDLLDLTRIARGQLTLQLRPADAHELLQTALEIVQNEIQQRHLTFSVALTASRHELIADACRLQQVFWNLLRNACKFTPENGTISVRSHNPSPGRITIEISDKGIGIEPQFVGRVFNAFEQADSQSEGLGLGLTISKAVVEMHAGAIRAHSEGLGKGATFAIELPIRGSTPE
jgi:signal transduction histidine kinase